MAKKRVSKLPDLFFKAARDSFGKVLSGEEQVKDCFDEDLPVDATEEDLRKRNNAFVKEMYVTLKNGGHVNYPGGPAQLIQDVESGRGAYERMGYIFTYGV